MSDQEDTAASTEAPIDTSTENQDLSKKEHKLLKMLGAKKVPKGVDNPPKDSHPEEKHERVEIGEEPDFTKSPWSREESLNTFAQALANKYFEEKNIKEPWEVSKFILPYGKSVYCVPKSAIKLVYFVNMKNGNYVFKPINVDHGTALGYMHKNLKATVQKNPESGLCWQNLDMTWRNLMLLEGTNAKDGTTTEQFFTTCVSKKENEEFHALIEDGTYAEGDVCNDSLRLIPLIKDVSDWLLKSWHPEEPGQPVNKDAWLPKKIANLDHFYNHKPGAPLNPEMCRHFIKLGPSSGKLSLLKTVATKLEPKKGKNGTQAGKRRPSEKTDDLDDEDEDPANVSNAQLIMAVRTQARYQARYMMDVMRPLIKDVVTEALLDHNAEAPPSQDE